jgi:hypothetical protein
LRLNTCKRTPATSPGFRKRENHNSCVAKQYWEEIADEDADQEVASETIAADSGLPGFEKVEVKSN